MTAPFLISSVAALLSLQLAASQTLPTAWTKGIATNYGGAQDGMDPSKASFGTSEGACGYGQLSTSSYPYWSVAALSTSNKYSLAGPSQACGQCFEIQCLNSGGSFAGRCSSSQSITVTITDVCPECEADHIDIQALSFNKIAPMALGRIDIQYRRVDCTPPEAVQLAIDSNVGVGGWLRLVVEKTAGFGGITLVQMRTTGTTAWNALTNKFGSAWEISSTPPLPWDFQFTSDSKQTVQAYSLVSQNGKVGDVPTGVQFSLSGSTGSTTIDYDAGASGGPPAASTPAGTPAGSTTPVGTPAAATSATPTATAAAAAATPTVTAATTADTPAATQAGCCVDSLPPGGLTCPQQKAYGKCDAGWMTAGSFCQLTCGRCPASCSGAASGSGAASATASGSGPASVETSSITNSPGSPTPTTPTSTPSAPTTTSAATPAGPKVCQDTPFPGATESCAALAAKGQCYTAIGAGYCDKSCYRC